MKKLTGVEQRYLESINNNLIGTNYLVAQFQSENCLNQIIDEGFMLHFNGDADGNVEIDVATIHDLFEFSDFIDCLVEKI